MVLRGCEGEKQRARGLVNADVTGNSDQSHCSDAWRQRPDWRMWMEELELRQGTQHRNKPSLSFAVRGTQK